MTGRPEHSSTRTVLVLLNPGAGQRETLQNTQQHLEERGGRHLELVIPDPSDQDRQISQARGAVEKGVDAVVVCGGDGMVGAAVNLVARRGIPMGVVPAGTGNDFSRAAGVPRRRGQALRRVLDALDQPELPTRAVDAMRLRVRTGREEVRTHWAANVVNIGFDARVNQRANAQRRVPRRVRYLAALVQEVPRFRPLGFEVEREGAAPTHWESALVCLQNGPFIGGGIPLAPQAQIDDGYAEVSHVAPLSRAGLVGLFPLLMMRMHRLLRPLTTTRMRRLRIQVPAGVPVFADGDEFLPGGDAGGRVETQGAELEVTLVPGAVLLLGRG